MSAAPIVLLEIALLLTTGLVVARGALRTTIAIVLACGCLALPIWLPAQPSWLRFVLALASQLSVLRTIEVLRDARPHGAAMRMFAFVAPLDALAVTAARPRLDVRGVAYAIATSMLGGIGVAMVWLAPLGTWHWPVASLGCAIGMLGTMDALACTNRALLRAVGIESPAVQDEPWRARTVAEFWSRRWNRAVGAWLRRFCFAPLARRGHVVMGMLAAFVVSAWIHFWPVLVAVGLAPALAMGGFFVAQAMCIVVEAKLGVARWRRPAQHAWTIAVMLGASPLFCVPMLLVLGYR